MWSVIIGVVFIMHGLANLVGFFESFGGKVRTFNDRPWIFSDDVKLQTGPGRIFGIFWLASTVFLVGAGVVILLHQPWWDSAAAAGAGLSLLAILPWWNTVVPGARFAAIFDTVLLIGLLTPLRELMERSIGG